MSDLDPQLSDKSVFPDPVYKETVLRPLLTAPRPIMSAASAASTAPISSC